MTCTGCSGTLKEDIALAAKLDVPGMSSTRRRLKEKLCWVCRHLKSSVFLEMRSDFPPPPKGTKAEE